MLVGIDAYLHRLRNHDNISCSFHRLAPKVIRGGLHDQTSSAIFELWSALYSCGELECVLRRATQPAKMANGMFHLRQLVTFAILLNVCGSATDPMRIGQGHCHRGCLANRLKRSRKCDDGRR